MKLICFLVILFSSPLFSQQPAFRKIREVKINDSLIIQTGELSIFNNTGHTICIKVSTEFAARVLGRDTIQFGYSNAGDDCNWYDLWVTKRDLEMGLGYEFPRYPMVLSNRTAFVTFISVVKDVKCKNFGIEFDYVNQEGINYNEFLIKYEKHEAWDRDLKWHYQTGKILL